MCRILQEKVYKTHITDLDPLTMPLTNGCCTDDLITLHWLHLPERVDFKVAVMAYRVLHGLAPPYLSQLARVADLPSRRRLRSSSTHQLHVPPFRLSTRRSSFFSRCRSHTLEHTAGGCSVIPFTSGLPTASEDIPLPQIISWCCMTGRLRFRGLSNGLLLF